jgi:hypothetical protein
MARVYKVNFAAAYIVASNPKSLVIFALGSVSSSGWTNPELVPWIYIVPPADGIYDFDMEATPPSGINTPVITPIAVGGLFPSPPKGLKGVRIHGTANEVVVLLDKRNEIEFEDAKVKPMGGGNFPWPGTLAQK